MNLGLRLFYRHDWDLQGVQPGEIVKTVPLGPGQGTRISTTLSPRAQALRDARKLARSGLKPKAQRLLEILRTNPCQEPPPCERLVGDLAGACSRRINIHHRLVCQILDDLRTVKVIRMWTHYE